jgi:hypothetical protein
MTRIDYCEVVPHSATVLVLRLRFANCEHDEYSARDHATGRYVSGLGSYKAALAALEVA